MSFSDFIAGERILEIKNFYVSKYNILYDIDERGYFINLIYKNEIKTFVPKNLIKNNSGYLMFSFTCYDLNEFGEIKDENYEGSIVYLYYKIENGKIYFTKA